MRSELSGPASVRPTASAEEAAAIVAALESFMRDTAPTMGQQPGDERLDGWRRTALLEGTSRTAQDEDVAWISPSPG
jgi:hypothetical protein